ncbi:histidine kinase [Chryseobacterium sp. SNU WT5]|uniref:sensor histidine kinase n=1 Tax=Chryseobacterium sp. SNU WT5 TaxID=2594269 RepID=UPI00117C8CF0|nr:histidine kinase [Chryseobacterium sp. SNU WT5]QDP85583.1 histidine kinase [Chryseobacterium sp. SNU WT5]
MYKSNKIITPFLDRISHVNFDVFYTPANRVLSHLFMWFIFFTLLFLNYSVELELSLKSSVLLTIRGMINNMTVFYIFFYLIVPQIFKSKGWGIALLIVSVPITVYIWLSTNYFQFKILDYLAVDIHQGPLKDIVKNNAKQSFFEAVSLKNVFGNAMIVIYSFSPPFFVKILFDIVRLFNRTTLLQKQSSELELENINIEKDFLKSQLNPHFLFNTLNNLYGLVVKKDPSAPGVIINFSDLMAYTLYESNTEKVPLQKELDFITNYFSLERMRYSADKDITLNISVPEGVEDVCIAPLLTFTFIENAFKYGLKANENNFLKINVDIADDIFSFSIQNDSENKSTEIKTLGGIGMKNVKKRLNLIYPDKHNLMIENKENCFSVFLSINLK